MYLTPIDYSVTIIMLIIPLAIGVYYAYRDAKNVNREEYLMGGRKMGLLPVSLSMFVTNQSAIALIGVTSDIYAYGIMIVGFYIGFCASVVIGLYVFIPLLHPLKMTSVYDYLERRFKSRAVRMLSTIIGMLQGFFYMVIALVAPGLALQAAAGIPFWMSVAVVGGVGTLYTTIGGFKSVVWTDVFQAVIMAVGVVLLIIRGTIAVGGSNVAYDVAEAGGRISMNRFSPDPRIRHTWWGVIIGACFVWLPNVFSQSNFQRVASVEKLKSAQMAFALNIPFYVVAGLLMGAVGVLVYVYVSVTRCDPLQTGLISNLNQISVYFMIDLFRDTPGLAGLYMASIFSSALSTLSSGINSLAANTVEDILAKRLRRVSERTATIITKMIVLAYGLAIIGGAYLCRAYQGPITQIIASTIGAIGSVVVGMFLVGCLVPWANKYGVLIGGAITSVFNMWIVIGGLLHGVKTRRLPSPPTDGCPSALLDRNDTTTTTTWFISASHWNNSDNNNNNYYYDNNNNDLNIMSSAVPPSSVSMKLLDDSDSKYEYGFFLYDISYEWYGFIGTLVCCVTILIASHLTRHYDKTASTDSKLIVPGLRRFWKLDDVDAVTVVAPPAGNSWELEPLNL